jgi:hypothetical protein
VRSLRALMSRLTPIVAVALLGPAGAQAATSPLTVSSSSSYLVNGFNWAKSTSLGYVRTGTSGEIPCYWAGLLTRHAFYSRDWAHQSEPAHLLGLDLENRTMLAKFAGSATSARKWYPLWSFGFDGSIYPSDYKGDTNFVREIPAVFELVEKGYRQYLWTGDSYYINDPTLWAYYGHAVNDFVSLHDSYVAGNGVADEYGGTSFWQGVPTYNEQGDGIQEAGDGIGAQYQALLAYAGVQRARGDNTGASTTQQRATNLKSLYESRWWSTSANRYARGFSNGGATTLTNWGKENSFFMPLKKITAPGTRNNGYLDFVHTTLTASKANIEAQTYVPEVFFPYGQDERGWTWLKYILDSRNLYPEVAFTVLAQTAEGLLGIEPNAPTHALATRSHLPAEVGWAELNHIRLGAHDLKLRVDGKTKAALTQNGGSASVSWEAQFPGSFSTLFVNGTGQTATQKTVLGVTVSFVTPSVAPGATVTVATTGGTATPTPISTATPTPTATPGPTATPVPGTFSGYYRLTARHSGKAVVVQAASTSNGANVFQWTYGGIATNDEWELRSIGSGYYRVINRLSGKDLVVQSASTSDGANIIQYTYGGTTTNDEWAIVSVGSGYYQIANRNGGKSVEVAGGGTTDGTNVDQRTYSAATYQQFQIVSVP